MRNIKLTIEYDGTAYSGWQVQKNKKTIQETTELTLKKLFKENIKLAGSGRTDAGVHAIAQAANFKIKHAIPPEKLQKALNSALPKDIIITGAELAGNDFHARFSAKSKVYRYTILNQPYPSAFLRNKALFCPYKLNIAAMRREAKALIGRHDFRSFCVTACAKKNTIRTVKRVEIKKKLLDGRYPVIECIIEADGFLYNMVRSITGTLLEAAKLRMPEGGIRKILMKKNRAFAGPTLPARGLCLMEVKY